MAVDHEKQKCHPIVRYDDVLQHVSLDILNSNVFTSSTSETFLYFRRARTSLELSEGRALLVTDVASSGFEHFSESTQKDASTTVDARAKNIDSVDGPRFFPVDSVSNAGLTFKFCFKSYNPIFVFECPLPVERTGLPRR
jgi:hypothetical protein